MKAMLKRTKGMIWRSIVGLPPSVVMLGVVWVMQTTLKGVDASGQMILKEWHRLQGHMDQSINVPLTQLAWIILYLPFMILSIITLILILYPIWFVIKPISDKLCQVNINLLVWIEYREAYPEEQELVQKAVETLRQKLKAEGMTEQQLAEMFKSNG